MMAVHLKSFPHRAVLQLSFCAGALFVRILLFVLSLFFRFLRWAIFNRVWPRTTEREHDPFEEALSQVPKLEHFRRCKGYKAGWLYHQCKHSQLLMEALEHLQETGELSRGHQRTSRARTESRSEGQSSQREQRQESKGNTQPQFDPFRVLGVCRGAEKDEIKRKYREQMKLYHPDRVAHLGAELQELALEKTKEIQKAYSMLSPG